MEGNVDFLDRTRIYALLDSEARGRSSIEVGDLLNSQLLRRLVLYLDLLAVVPLEFMIAIRVRGGRILQIVSLLGRYARPCCF